MSKLSEIFDALVSRTSSTLPSYIHLSDGLELDKNTNTALVKGYSVVIGDNGPGPEQYGCAVQLFQRNYTISITNAYTMRNNATTRDDAEKSIMEDLYLVTKSLISTPSLGGIACNVQFVSDSGTEYLNNEYQEFLIAELTLNIWYEEAL